jgi:hypothetical protein
MERTIEEHWLPALAAFRTVGCTRDVYAIPAGTKLTTNRRLFFRNHGFSHS